MAEVGMNWLLKARPDIRPTMSVNEGGGERFELTDGRSMVGVGIGEKGTYPARVTAVGEAGHGSMPTLGDNAVPHLADLITQIGRGLPTPVAHPLVDRMLEVLLGDAYAPGDDLPAALAAAGALHPELEHVMPALAGTTMAPTMVGGSDKRNTQPSRAWVELDCRVLPDTTEADVEAAVRDRLGEGPAYELSWPEPLIPGNASPPDGPVVQAIRDWVMTEVPDAVLLPSLGTGITDSSYLRAAAGTAAYGFSPFFTTPLEVYSPGSTTPTSGCTSTTCTPRSGSTSTLPRSCWHEGTRARHRHRHPRARRARRDHRRGRRQGRAHDPHRRRRRADRCHGRGPPPRPRVGRPGLRGLPPPQRQRRDDGLAVDRRGRPAALPHRDHQHPQRGRRPRRAGRDRGRVGGGGVGAARRGRDLGRHAQRRQRLPRHRRARQGGVRRGGRRSRRRGLRGRRHRDGVSRLQRRDRYGVAQGGRVHRGRARPGQPRPPRAVPGQRRAGGAAGRRGRRARHPLPLATRQRLDHRHRGDRRPVAAAAVPPAGAACVVRRGPHRGGRREQQRRPLPRVRDRQPRHASHRRRRPRNGRGPHPGQQRHEPALRRRHRGRRGGHPQRDPGLADDDRERSHRPHAARHLLLAALEKYGRAATPR